MKYLRQESCRTEPAEAEQRLVFGKGPLQEKLIHVTENNEAHIFTVALFILVAFFNPYPVYSTGNSLESDFFQEFKKETDSLRRDANYLRTSATLGGKANETGLKTWQWQDVALPVDSGKKGHSFSDGELHVDSECYEQQVTRIGNQLKFTVDPTYPKVKASCSRKYNMRAEIRTSPWNVRHTIGTEEWFGWSYTFGSEYKIDRHNQWLFFQVHPGIMGVSPQIEFTVIKDGQATGHKAGEIFIVNAANNKEYRATGIVPKAGETLTLVTHVVYGDADQGLLQVWINGKKVYDQQVATIYEQYPWGGNAKWGIYKWPWTQVKGVRKSKNQGIDSLETFMGPLRIITRTPLDQDYLSNGYFLVAPRER